MPEEKYSFAPTNGEFKGVRTFGEQVKHLTSFKYLAANCGSLRDVCGTVLLTVSDRFRH